MRVEQYHSVASQSSDGESIGDLISRLAEQASALARHEVRLARLEMETKARTAVRGAAMVAGGALIAYAGVIALVFALVWALNRVMPLWAAALIGGIVVIAVGVTLAYAGITQLRDDGVIPTKTIQTMKENARWAKRQVA